MRGAGLLLLGAGAGLIAGYLVAQHGNSPAWVWLGLGLLVLASVLLGLSRAGKPPGEGPAGAAADQPPG
jgi:hypothetical protein